MYNKTNIVTMNLQKFNNFQFSSDYTIVLHRCRKLDLYAHNIYIFGQIVICVLYWTSQGAFLPEMYINR